ncbi:hypothetical protein ABZ791_00375 [Streptomyces huasconensis]|uniref:Secreted protein n=1 Tax=Streptomyces huasconensis TaxID=1854574 RepID=A0ABV3LSJ3_9ACTN
MNRTGRSWLMMSKASGAGSRFLATVMFTAGGMWVARTWAMSGPQSQVPVVCAEAKVLSGSFSFEVKV